MPSAFTRKRGQRGTIEIARRPDSKAVARREKRWRDTGTKTVEYRPAIGVCTLSSGRDRQSRWEEGERVSLLDRLDGRRRESRTRLSSAARTVDRNWRPRWRSRLPGVLRRGAASTDAHPSTGCSFIGNRPDCSTRVVRVGRFLQCACAPHLPATFSRSRRYRTRRDEP